MEGTIHTDGPSQTATAAPNSPEQGLEEEPKLMETRKGPQDQDRDVNRLRPYSSASQSPLPMQAFLLVPIRPHTPHCWRQKHFIDLLQEGYSFSGSTADTPSLPPRPCTQVCDRDRSPYCSWSPHPQGPAPQNLETGSKGEKKS